MTPAGRSPSDEDPALMFRDAFSGMGTLAYRGNPAVVFRDVSSGMGTLAYGANPMRILHLCSWIPVLAWVRWHTEEILLLYLWMPVLAWEH